MLALRLAPAAGFRVEGKNAGLILQRARICRCIMRTVSFRVPYLILPESAEVPVRKIAMCGLVLLLAVGCGGDDDDPLDVNPNDNGSMTARVDGAAFTATTVAASFSNGILAISGVQVSPSQALTFGLAATAPGTFTVAATSPVNGIYAVGNATWLASGNVGSGQVIVTTLSSTRAVGTFNFVLAPNTPSGATGTRTITQGAFDVRF